MVDALLGWHHRMMFDEAGPVPVEDDAGGAGTDEDEGEAAAAVGVDMAGSSVRAVSAVVSSD
jgi:hypothetical protein